MKIKFLMTFLRTLKAFCLCLNFLMQLIFHKYIHIWEVLCPKQLQFELATQHITFARFRVGKGNHRS